MESTPRRCSAVTKSGSPCKNSAMQDSDFCRAHQSAVAAPEAPAASKSTPGKTPSPPPSAPALTDTPVPANAGPSTPVQPVRTVTAEQVAKEINRIADDVAKKNPSFSPPPFSPSALTAVLKANAEQLAAYLPTDFLKEIVRNLEGTRKEDLLDPETWKGFWYILTYSLSTQSRAALEEIGKRLDFVPGMDFVVQFSQSVIESPRDLLSVDTWKGALLVLNASVQASVSSLKRKVLGGGEE